MSQKNCQKIKLVKLLELLRKESDEQHSLTTNQICNYMLSDRFGENVNMMTTIEDRTIATVKVQFSPTFWGWLFQFGKQMRVISPDEIVKEYRARTEEVLG